MTTFVLVPGACHGGMSTDCRVASISASTERSFAAAVSRERLSRPYSCNRSSPLS